MTAFDRIDRRLTVITWMVGLNGLNLVLWIACLALLIAIDARLAIDRRSPTQTAEGALRRSAGEVSLVHAHAQRGPAALVDAGKGDVPLFHLRSAAAIAGTAAAMPWWCRRSV